MRNPLRILMALQLLMTSWMLLLSGTFPIICHLVDKLSPFCFQGILKAPLFYLMVFFHYAMLNIMQLNVIDNYFGIGIFSFIKLRVSKRLV